MKTTHRRDLNIKIVDDVVALLGPLSRAFPAGAAALDGGSTLAYRVVHAPLDSDGANKLFNELNEALEMLYGPSNPKMASGTRLRTWGRFMGNNDLSLHLQGPTHRSGFQLAVLYLGEDV
jgi:hypothetical protein